MNVQPTVYVVDDDRDIREAIGIVLRAAGLQFKMFRSAEELLESDIRTFQGPKCLVLDVRMPGLSGLGLQELLSQEGIKVPTVFLTAFGDVRMAVRALKGGAVDLVQKPFDREVLLDRIESALDLDAQAVAKQRQEIELRSRLDSLSKRERDIYRHLLDGKNNKEIAAALDIGIQTVAKHRAKLFQKLRVRNVVELVKAAHLIGET